MIKLSSALSTVAVGTIEQRVFSVRVKCGKIFGRFTFCTNCKNFVQNLFKICIQNLFKTCIQIRLLLY